MKKKLIYSEIFPYDVIAYVDMPKNKVSLHIVVRTPKEPQDGKLVIQVVDIEKFLEHPETISNHHPMRADASHSLVEVFANHYRRPIKKELEEVEIKILSKVIELFHKSESIVSKTKQLSLVSESIVNNFIKLKKVSDKIKI